MEARERDDERLEVSAFIHNFVVFLSLIFHIHLGTCLVSFFGRDFHNKVGADFDSILEEEEDNDVDYGLEVHKKEEALFLRNASLIFFFILISFVRDVENYAKKVKVGDRKVNFVDLDVDFFIQKFLPFQVQS